MEIFVSPLLPELIYSPGVLQAFLLVALAVSGVVD